MVIEKSMLNFGIYELMYSQIHYRDNIHNRKYHHFYYHDSKIFTIA